MIGDGGRVCTMPRKLRNEYREDGGWLEVVQRGDVGNEHGGDGWQARPCSKAVEGHRTPGRWRAFRRPRMSRSVFGVRRPSGAVAQRICCQPVFDGILPGGGSELSHLDAVRAGSLGLTGWVRANGKPMSKLRPSGGYRSTCSFQICPTPRATGGRHWVVAFESEIE